LTRGVHRAPLVVASHSPDEAEGRPASPHLAAGRDAERGRSVTVGTVAVEMAGTDTAAAISTASEELKQAVRVKRRRRWWS